LNRDKLFLWKISINVIIFLLDLSLFKCFSLSCFFTHSIIFGFNFPTQICGKYKKTCDDCCFLKISIMELFYVFLSQSVVYILANSPIVYLWCRLFWNLFLSFQNVDCSFSFVLSWLWLYSFKNLLSTLFVIFVTFCHY